MPMRGVKAFRKWGEDSLENGLKPRREVNEFVLWVGRLGK